MRNIVATVITLSVAILLSATITMHSDDAEDRRGNDGPSDGPVNDESLKGPAGKLVSMDWRRDAAKAVAEHNGEYFELLAEAAPTELDRTLKTLGRLGNKPLLQRDLLRHPELAGLLAGALEVDAEAPRRIVESVSDPDNRSVLLKLYGLHATPADCSALSRTLEREGDLIARLLRKGAADAVGWFEKLPETRRARATYRRWLRRLFEDALRSADEDALDRTQTLLTIHSRKILEKLEDDGQFREDFLSELDPMFQQVLDRQIEQDRDNDDDAMTGWGIHVQDPRIWDLLHRERKKGQQLFESYGPIAVDLLVDSPYEDCQVQVIEALEQNDRSTIAALYDENLREEPLFRKLLKRHLRGGTLAKAFFMLQAEHADAPRKLRYWDTLDDEALKEELGPPPEGAQTWLPGYSFYYLTRKYAQGRDITGMDIAMAAVDAAEVAMAAKGASKVVRAIGKKVGTGVARRVGSGTAEGLVEEAAKQKARGFAPWILRQGHREVRGVLKNLAKRPQVDVTDMVKFVYKKSGMGRNTFRRLTDLEARVFMRGDRRIVFDIPSLVGSGHPVGRYLRETALNAGVDTTLNTPAGAKAAETTIQAAAKTARTSRQQIEAWKKHIAAWWLAHATGTLDKAQ